MCKPHSWVRTYLYTICVRIRIMCPSWVTGWWFYAAAKKVQLWVLSWCTDKLFNVHTLLWLSWCTDKLFNVHTLLWLMIANTFVHPWLSVCVSFLLNIGQMMYLTNDWWISDTTPVMARWLWKRFAKFSLWHLVHPSNTLLNVTLLFSTPV